MPNRCDRSVFSFLTVLSSVWLCSEVGGQHADHHHRLGCGRSHRVINGLHAAQELYSLCSFQARGEKVSLIQGLIGNQLLNSLTFSPPPLLCSKECLVTSSGIDNTENGLSGSKAATKPTPKKKWESACQRTTTTIMSVSFLGTFAHSLRSCWDLITVRGPLGAKIHMRMLQYAMKSRCADDIQLTPPWGMSCLSLLSVSKWHMQITWGLQWWFHDHHRFLWLSFSLKNKGKKSTGVHLKVAWISIHKCVR